MKWPNNSFIWLLISRRPSVCLCSSVLCCDVLSQIWSIGFISWALCVWYKRLWIGFINLNVWWKCVVGHRVVHIDEEEKTRFVHCCFFDFKTLNWYYWLLERSSLFSRFINVFNHTELFAGFRIVVDPASNFSHISVQPAKQWRFKATSKMKIKH